VNSLLVVNGRGRLEFEGFSGGIAGSQVSETEIDGTSQMFIDGMGLSEILIVGIAGADVVDVGSSFLDGVAAVSSHDTRLEDNVGLDSSLLSSTSRGR
jgi:hypothetical protein